ncbi:hypothetical protein BGX34_010182 [Mortierella sp. NVP85]|nr:hypothetical protein BGX34_010182 [Mortierella sp. NVP85]
MSVRLVSSAKNLREQFKPTGSASGLSQSSPLSTGISRSQTLGPPSNQTLSRKNTLLRTSSSGNLRRSKSTKKGLMSKVFADEQANSHDSMPDMSMEMTHLIVKRCVKEIRERGKSNISGLTTKAILRQVHMAQSQKVIMDTIRIILDDDANTELSPLRRIDIHLVAHAMKWAIRYSEEILVTYEDYQALYLNQDRDFIRFARDLPPTNRAILLELFSLCADVTLLAHLNGMTLVSVAKAISLSIMAGPEREFTTFDASLQQRNLWGAACEELLRAFLRIKTTCDLAKIDQEDEVDENRYICNETRVLKSARQEASGQSMRLDISTPSSGCSTGWPTPSGIMTSGSLSNASGYFDIMPATSAPSLAHVNGSFGSSLSRSPSLSRTNRPVSMAFATPAYNADNIAEFEELMQDKTQLQQPRQDRGSLLRPAEQSIRRISSAADMDSLYMLPMENSNSGDGYESDPEVSHPMEDEESQDSLIPDFADGLGWDFGKAVELGAGTLDSLKSLPDLKGKYGVNRSNSASSNASGLGLNGPRASSPPRNIRDLSKDQLSDKEEKPMESQSSLQRMGSVNRARVGQAMQNSSTSHRSRHARSNSALRRSISMNHGRLHMKPGGLQADLLAQDLALQTEKESVAKDIRQRLHSIKDTESQEPIKADSAFPIQLSPLDLEKSGRPKSILELSLVEGLPLFTSESSFLDIGTVEPTIAKSKDELEEEPEEEPEDDGTGSIRSCEVVSRPRYVETNVVLPVATLTASPKSETFPDCPISSLPVGDNVSPKGRTKRSGTGSSSKSNSSNKSSSSASTQQTLSSTPPSESKSKKPAFIRAISSKLRSKQTDDQLKPVRVNNQVVGTPAVPPPLTIEPPRLELSFLGDILTPAELGPRANPEGSQLPLAPAVPVLHSDATERTLENLRREKQPSLPIPDNSSNGEQETRPKGYTGLRRSSATVFGSGNLSLREQRQKPKRGSSMPRPVSTVETKTENALIPTDEDSSSRAAALPSPRLEEAESQEASLSVDTTVQFQEVLSASPTESSIPEIAASEKEIHFSAATLLMDGKLYYQVIWDDECSDLGTQSDLFEPEQNLSGDHHSLGLPQEDPRKQQQQTESAATATQEMKQSNSNSQLMVPIAAADSCSRSLDLPGQQVGQMTSKMTPSKIQDQEPSPAQMEVAMEMARESFIALTSDPQVLEELMEMISFSEDRLLIINAGMFVGESVEPQMDWMPPVSSSQTNSTQWTNQHPYPSPYTTPNSSFNSIPSTEMTPHGDEHDSSLSISPATAGVARSMSCRTKKQPGPAAVGGGGPGSYASSSRGHHKRSDSASSFAAAGGLTGVKKSKKFFGKKVIKMVVKKMAGGSSSERKRKLLPIGMLRQDAMTKTVESMDEVFPWMCIEHMTGEESEWVMLEPVQNGAVGWIVIDKLDDFASDDEAQ